MARLTPDNVTLAREIIDRYPRPKSALIPLLHLAQEQDGHVTDEAMEHIAELVGVTPAEVLGTASFYEMFKFEPVGRYMVNICTNIACQLLGGEELLEHAAHKLGIRPGQTTPDGLFPIEDAECIAACTEQTFRLWGYMHLHDPLAVGLAVDASLARWQPARIAVGESGQTRRAAGAPNCRVALDIDAARFLALFFDRLCPTSS